MTQDHNWTPECVEGFEFQKRKPKRTSPPQQNVPVSSKVAPDSRSTAAARLRSSLKSYGSPRDRPLSSRNAAKENKEESDNIYYEKKDKSILKKPSRLSLRRKTISWYPANASLEPMLRRNVNNKEYEERPVNREYLKDFEVPAENPNAIKHRDSKSIGGRRRSSLAQRGKRVSSAHNGLCSLPHETIDPSYFYRHIDAEQSEPIRMRQLLVWCAQKAMNTSMLKESKLFSIVKSVQNEILEGLVAKKINTSWYQRESGSSTDLEKAAKIPHPTNEANKARVAELSTDIERLKVEKQKWLDILGELNQRHARILDVCEGVESFLSDPKFAVTDADEETRKNALKSASEHAEGFVTYSCLSDDKQYWIQEWNTKEDDKAFEKWAQDIFPDIQHEIYRLQFNLHRALAVEDTITRKFCNDISAEMTRAFADREKKELSQVEPMELLKLLSTTTATVN